MIAAVPKVKMYLVKVLNIFTFTLAKDQSLVLLRFIRQPFNLPTAGEKKNHKTWKGKFLEARRPYLINGGEGGAEFAAFQVFWENRQL